MAVFEVYYLVKINSKLQEVDYDFSMYHLPQQSMAQFFSSRVAHARHLHLQ